MSISQAFRLRSRTCVLALTCILGAALAASSASAQQGNQQSKRKGRDAPPAAQSQAQQPSPTAQVQTKSMKIQEITSPGGIRAWLVESHNVPLLALRFAFEGGSAQDPADKAGVANFMTAMMDEGAGDLDHTAFQERMEETAMRMSFEDGRDHMYGNFETLTANRDRSVALLKLAITRPRFEAEAADRIRKQLAASLAFAARDPNKVAGKAWSAGAFPNHPYGRPSEGTPESLANITSDDLRAYHRRVFAKDKLSVVAVGDIDAKTLGTLVDTVFGELPDKAQLNGVPDIEIKSGGALQVIEMPVPQSVATFGISAPKRKDKDFMTAFVINQILGGGGFASRLMEEVREKRGLAYSVYSYLSPMAHTGVFAGGVATKNEEMRKSLDVIKAELKRMADEGPTEIELANAKSYLTGSYALRFDTNAKIAAQLLGIMVEDLGIDYVEKRNAQIDAITIADAKRVAKSLLKVDDLVVTIVGKPDGMPATAAKPTP